MTLIFLKHLFWRVRLAMFRLPAEAKDWYKNIQASKMKTPLFVEEWDLYYLCLLYGITEGESEVKDLHKAQDMSKNFTLRYSGSKYSLLTLLMMAHANRFKIDLTNREQLEEALNGFIDQDQDSGFSLNAIEKMNQYAYAGFDLLSDKVPALTNSSVGIDEIFKDLNKKMDTFIKKFKL